MRTRAGVRRLPFALLFAFAVTLLGVGKGWAQCTPNGQAGSTLYYNNCGASSVTFEHTVVGSSPKVLWSATEPPVAYSADFGTNGNFQLNATNARNCTWANDVGVSTVQSSGDVMILMSNLGSFDPNVYKYFIIHYHVLRFVNVAQRLEIFWYADGQGATGASASRVLTMDHNTTDYSIAWPQFAGQALTVVIDASKHPEWTAHGNITGWRLDPVASSLSTNTNPDLDVIFAIDYIALSSVKPVEAGVTLEASYTNPNTSNVRYSAQNITVNGLDTYGYSTTKTISNPSPGESWYSDNLRNWSCNSSSIKHEFCGFDPGAITTSSSTICYGRTSALPQITEAAAPDGTAPYTYQWKHTYNGVTNVISGATGATYTPNVSTYNTQAGEHVRVTKK